MSDQKALALALAQQSYILQFSQEMKMFGFKNEAGEAALRFVVATAYAACADHFARTGLLRAKLSHREMANATGMYRGRAVNAANRLKTFGVVAADTSKKLYTLRSASAWKSGIAAESSGRTDEAIKGHEGGRTRVASSQKKSGLTHEATFAPKTASPARPFPYSKLNGGPSYDKIGEPPKGAGAGSTRPKAPVTKADRGFVISDDESVITDDAHLYRAPSALEGPVGAYVGDSLPAVASDPDHYRDRPIAPVAEADAPWPGNDERQAEVRVYEGQPVTEADLDALADEEAETTRRVGIKAGGGWSWDFEDEADLTEAQKALRRDNGLSRIEEAFKFWAPAGADPAVIVDMFVARFVDGARAPGWGDLILRIVDAESALRVARGDLQADAWRRTILGGLASYAEGSGVSAQVVESATAALVAELDGVANFEGVANG